MSTQVVSVVVIAEAELGLLARLGQPFEQPEPAVDPGQAAAAVVDPPGDDLEGERRAGVADQAEDAGVDVGAEGVDVVDHQPAEVRVVGRASRASVPLRSRLGTS